MIPSSTLFNLIKSLTKSEKRNFTIYASKTSESSNYLKLYRAMDGLEVYDEEKIKVKLEKEEFVKRLAVTKYQLYKLIMQSLNDLHSATTPDARLRALLSEVEILYNRRLYVQCEKVLVKVNELCVFYGCLSYMLEGIRWQKKLLFLTGTGNLQEQFAYMQQREQKISEQIYNETQYVDLLHQVLYYQTLLVKHRDNQPMPELHQIVIHPLLEDEKYAHTFIAKVYYYEIHGIYCLVTGDIEAAYQLLTHIKTMWTVFPGKIPAFRDCYHRTMASLAICEANLPGNAQASCESLVAMFKKETLVNVHDRVTADSLAIIVELEYKMATAQLHSCGELVDSAADMLKAYPDTLAPYWTGLFYHQAILFYFHTRQYRKSINYINELLYNSDRNLLRAFKDFARILLLVIHYEQGNLDVLDYLHRSTYRSLQKEKRMGRFEKLMLGQFKKLLAASSEKEKQLVYSYLKTQIEQLTQAECPIQGAGVGMLLEWLNGKSVPVKNYGCAGNTMLCQAYPGIDSIS